MATSSAPRSSRLMGTTALSGKCLHEDSACSVSMSLPYSYLHQQEKTCSRSEIPVPSCRSSQTEGRSRLCSIKCDSFSAYPQCSSTAHLLMLETPWGPMLTGFSLRGLPLFLLRSFLFQFLFYSYLYSFGSPAPAYITVDSLLF